MLAWKQSLITLILMTFGIKGLYATSSVTTLPYDLQNKLVAEKIWQPGCPTTLTDLRLIKINYYTYSGTTQQGQIVVNKDIASNVAEIFHVLYARKYPIAKISTLISYHGNLLQAEQDNVTYGFICRQDTLGNYNVEANGKTITLNPVLNPEVVAIQSSKSTPPKFCQLLNFLSYCKKKPALQTIQVLPAAGIISINRNLKLPGMAEPVVSVFAKYGLTKWSGNSVTDANWKKFSAE